MAILNFIVKLVSRIFMPGLAKNMAEEGTFDFTTPGGTEGDFDRSKFIQVEDKGSDITIVSFAGAAVLFAGMPQFEFRKMLNENENNYNLVFVRDPRRSAYFEHPHGGPGGVEFYMGLVNDTLKELGSSYNVALGASAGGAGAFYVSSFANINQIVAFAPGFPPVVYTKPTTQLKTYFNIKKLLTEPAAYAEVVLVTLAAQLVMWKVNRVHGANNLPDITQCYLDVTPAPPRATIFYGERCLPDRLQAMHHRNIPSITLKPINSGRHNCAADLKKQGILGKTILAEIEAGLRASCANRDAISPPSAEEGV
ncbi:MAG: hypothetical protein L3K26_15170 [Candidatus Hydrogenedentes bacterium]|nr:hypothetical protein [Candidatus Hydrogenedentota bacterium]